MVQRYVPVKIAPWQRKLKALTYVITAGAAYYLIFWQDWTRVSQVPPDHLFARIQQTHRDYLRRVLGEKYVKDRQSPYDIISDSSLDAKAPESTSSKL